MIISLIKQLLGIDKIEEELEFQKTKTTRIVRDAAEEEAEVVTRRLFVNALSLNSAEAEVVLDLDSGIHWSFCQTGLALRKHIDTTTLNNVREVANEVLTEWRDKELNTEEFIDKVVSRIQAKQL